jgi:hypothetical protein
MVLAGDKYLIHIIEPSLETTSSGACGSGKPENNCLNGMGIS